MLKRISILFIVVATLAAAGAVFNDSDWSNISGDYVQHSPGWGSVNGAARYTGSGPSMMVSNVGIEEPGPMFAQVDPARAGAGVALRCSLTEADGFVARLRDNTTLQIGRVDDGIFTALATGDDPPNTTSLAFGYIPIRFTAIGNRLRAEMLSSQSLIVVEYDIPAGQETYAHNQHAGVWASSGTPPFFSMLDDFTWGDVWSGLE